MRGRPKAQTRLRALRLALNDRSPSVRIAAAETLGRYGRDADAELALQTLLELAPAATNGVYVAVAALNAIDAMGKRATVARDALKSISTTDPNADDRLSSYVPRLLEHILERL